MRSLLRAGTLGAVLAEPAWAQAAARQYGDFPVIGSRAAIWVAAQLHLFFAAFVLDDLVA